MGEALYERADRATARARPAASTRRSAAIATSSPISCAGCWRTAPTRPSSPSRPTRPCRSRRCCERPAALIGTPPGGRHPQHAAAARPLWPGAAEFARRRARPPRRLDALLRRSRPASPRRSPAAPLVGGIDAAGADRRACLSPIDGARRRPRRRGDAPIAPTRCGGRARGFPRLGRATPAERRAAALGARRRPAGGAARPASSRCSQSEAGKTLDDALAELREAVDFCRYYAAEARGAVRRGRGAARPDRRRATCLRHRGRGVFVCICPWNFPLAIFLGQVAAALAAGNAVVAKPAEQTPLVAAEAVRLLHEAGVPASALHLVPGDGGVGARARRAPARRRRRLHRLDRDRRGASTARSPPRTARSCR